MTMITILDGGMGRELERSGAPFRQPEWSALALIEAPETVARVHEGYIKAGAQVIQPIGEVLTQTNIGPRLATRDLMQDIRAANPFHQGGGAAFSKAERSYFLQSLDRVLMAARRASGA